MSNMLAAVNASIDDQRVTHVLKDLGARTKGYTRQDAQDTEAWHEANLIVSWWDELATAEASDKEALQLRVTTYSID